MIPTLSPLFTGDLAPIAENLVLDDDPREGLPGSALLERPVLRDLLARFAATYDQPDPKAVASLWSKWHFSVFATPVIAASLAADHELPVALSTLEIIPHAGGRTAAVRLPHAGGPIAPDTSPFSRFDRLRADHLDPLIDALAAEGGLAPKVLWGNLGALFERVVARIEQGFGPDHPGVVAGTTILTGRSWPGRSRNPLYAPVRYMAQADGPPLRLRKVCCLRYLIPALDTCQTCPLDPAKQAAAVPRAREQSA